MKQLPTPQSIILVRGCLTKPKDAFLAVDKLVVCSILCDQNGTIAICCFFVLNLGGVYTTTLSGENEDFSIRFGRAFTPKR